jgi:hypothetical protein
VIHEHRGDEPVAAGADVDVEPGAREDVGVVGDRGRVAQGDARLVTLQGALKRLGRYVE